jgi:hypothetical protein
VLPLPSFPEPLEIAYLARLYSLVIAPALPHSVPIAQLVRATAFITEHHSRNTVRELRQIRGTV